MRYFSKLLSFLYLIFIVSGCTSGTDKQRTEDTKNAKEALFNTLKNQNGWDRIHAFEYLIDLGYSDKLDPSLIKQLNVQDSVNPLSIGVWRTLAKIDQGHSADWKQKIEKQLSSKDIQLKDHAYEALAKLKLKDRSYYLDFLKSDAENQSFGTELFALWTVAFDKNKVDKIYQYVHSDLLNIEEKKRALYILSKNKNISSNQWRELTRNANHKAETDSLKLPFIAAAFVNTPSDQLGSSEFKALEDYLLTNLKSPSTISVHAILALSEFGSLDHIGIYKKAFSDNKALEQPSAAINSAISYAILRSYSIHTKTLGFWDWLVIAIYLGSMLLIGWYYSSKNKSAEDYLLGGRSMNPITVGISLFATLLSTLSYLSYPGEMVKFGPVIFTGMLAFPFVFWAVGWWIIPKIMQVNVTSAYEILEMRLGLNVRMLAVVFFLSLRLLWMATIMYVTIDVALFSIVPLDKSLAPVFGFVMLIITILYTSMGGVKAVVITDVVQSLILIGGTLLCIFFVMYNFGSFTAWLPTEWYGHWSEFKIEFDTNERLTVGNAVLTLFLWYICTAGGDQTAIQRYLSTKDVQAARKTLGVSLLTNLAAKILLALVGLALLAFFTKNSEMLKYGKTLQDQADEIFPRFIILILPEGLSGLLIAALLAAAMSSLSSGINSVATVLSADFIKRFQLPFFTQKSELGKVKVLSYLIGLVVILLSLFIGQVEGNLIDISNKVVNLFVAPIFVLFFMAFFVPFASSNATFVAGLVSIIIGIMIAFFGFLGITVLWILPASLFAGVVTGVLLSYMEKKIFFK
ncbi:sodium:solute symporter family transporter [Sphingobacterium hotanense]|uniref:sodium:solute symporter family transporter n=1 Tax=Sphingobacterium hotanense TaxID=649196 RepID=UPI0021A29E46|nr:hypothetical protein [Sphingobacterium hotanense]MCT1526040.1 hypothetical protein [Sphingobacterium hotanense]